MDKENAIGIDAEANHIELTDGKQWIEILSPKLRKNLIKFYNLELYIKLRGQHEKVR